MIRARVRVVPVGFSFVVTAGIEPAGRIGSEDGPGSVDVCVAGSTFAIIL
jgi:hypothetical protein